MTGRRREYPHPSSISRPLNVQRYVIVWQLVTSTLIVLTDLTNTIDCCLKPKTISPVVTIINVRLDRRSNDMKRRESKPQQGQKSSDLQRELRSRELEFILPLSLPQGADLAMSEYDIQVSGLTP